MAIQTLCLFLLFELSLISWVYDSFYGQVQNMKLLFRTHQTKTTEKRWFNLFYYENKKLSKFGMDKNLSNQQFKNPQYIMPLASIDFFIPNATRFITMSIYLYVHHSDSNLYLNGKVAATFTFQSIMYMTFMYGFGLVPMEIVFRRKSKLN